MVLELALFVARGHPLHGGKWVSETPQLLLEHAQTKKFAKACPTRHVAYRVT